MKIRIFWFWLNIRNLMNRGDVKKYVWNHPIKGSLRIVWESINRCWRREV